VCHPDAPPGGGATGIPSAEISIPLPGGEALPCLAVGADDAPPVLIAPDVFGRSPFYEHLAGLLAQAGLRAVLADVFFRQGPLTERSHGAAFARRRLLDETNSIEDLRAAVESLRPSERASVGLLGFCMGGTFVLDLASTDRDLVAVAFYGFPRPQPTLVSPPPAPADLVEGLRGPVLAIWGSEDEAVGAENIEHYVKQAARVNPEFEWKILSGLGHGFLGQADLEDETDPGGAMWARAVGHFTARLGV
jgi:carboxymethylenebutenolidase